MNRFFLLFILVLFSCGSSKKNTETKVKEIKKELVISLERTPCYGTCPIYKMEIFSDGSAFYHGERFVDRIGDYEFSVRGEVTPCEPFGIASYETESAFTRIRWRPLQ